ncbi:MAG: T9SS type A sorting domain-containing protein [Taibaiella sp.]|nr:T9SS type A sorting domain-containing protein [Taibaiella sp.]
MKKIYSFLLTLLPFYAHAQSGIITTILDTCCTFADSSGLHTTYDPEICVDASENIYTAHYIYNVIRKTSPSGIITTIAGTGSAGYSGDGGPATAAKFYISVPDSFTRGALAIDRWGNLYLTDKGNHRVRKIDTNGIVTTISGTGVAGNTGDGGAATAAQVSGLSAICVDRMGNVYFYQRNSNTIRKIDTAGIVSTIAGNGSSGTMYFGYSPAIPATSGTLDRVYKLATDGDGNLYTLGDVYVLKITPAGLGRIIAINGNGEYVPPITGNGGPATAASNGYINGIGVSGEGNVYLTCVSDYGYVIRKIDRSEIITSIAGQSDTIGYGGDGIPPEEATLNITASISVNEAGTIFFTDEGALTEFRIKKITFPTEITTDSFSTYLHSRCSGVDFLTVTNAYSPSHSIVTQFGDGTSDTATTLSGYGGGYMSTTHNYASAGTYTIRQMLYDGSTPIDSVTQSYTHRFCNSMTLRYYVDTNGNCIHDSAERYNLYGVRVRVDSNGIAVDTISGAAGIHYNAYGSAGDVYTYTPISISGGLYASCPAAGIITDTLSSVIDYSSENNIGLSCDTLSGFDFSLRSFVIARPMVYEMYLTANNYRCLPTDAVIKLVLPGYYSEPDWFIPTPTSIVGNVVTWNVSNLSLTGTGPAYFYLRMTHTTGTFFMPGDTVNSVITITPNEGDLDTLNNVVVSNDIVRAAWDPNDIAVTPEGNVLNGTTLQYTIRFENTGNDTAHNIHVLDTLSDDLDPSTIEIIAASAAMDVHRYTAGGHTVIKFDFPNIMLPDSSHHGLCHGMLVYKIKTRTGLPHGRTIPNGAGIYFDTNPVVLTNTVTNTILIPSISIATAGSGVICSGDTAVFTATSASIRKPRYMWIKNGVVLGIDTSVVAFTGLSMGDVISCRLYSPGGDSLIATSATIVMTVNTVPAAGVITGPFTVCAAATIILSHTTAGGTWTSSSPANATVVAGFVAGVAAGTTVISYTMNNMCGTTTVTKSITVNPLPVPGTVSGDVHVCVASTITHSTTGTGGYWHASNPNATVSSGGVVTGVNAGAVFISYTALNSCGTASSTAPVIVDPLPVAGTLGGATSVCVAATATLTATASGGSWSNDGTTATVAGGIVSGIAAGTTTISYAVTNGCGTATTIRTMTVNPLPVAGTISGADSVCTAATTTLSPSLTGGTWSVAGSAATVSGGMVSGIAAGTAMVSYSISNVCGTATATHIIVVNPLPDAGTISGADSVCVSSSIPLVASMPGGVWSSSSSDATVLAGSVTGVAAGIATISWSVTNSCGTDIATHAVIVNPLPVAGSLSGDTVICPGASAALTTTESGGIWSATGTAASVSAGVVSGISPGTAVISYAVTNVCGTATATHSMLIHALPDAGAITGAATVCIGDTIVLSAGMAGGSWAGSNSNVWLNNGTVAGITAGSVIISYTVANICGSSTATTSIIVEPCPVSVNGITTTAGPRINPNPATGAVVIYADPGKYQRYELTDNTGRKLQYGTITNAATPIDISLLAPGMYYIKTDGAAGVYVQKIIKQ